MRCLDDRQLAITDTTCLPVRFKNPLLEPGIPRICGALKREFLPFPGFIDFNFTACT